MLRSFFMEEEVQLKDSQDKGPELGPETGLEEIDFGPILDFFDMDRPLLQEKNDIRELHNWAVGEGAKTRSEILQKIKELDIQLGAPPTGESKIRRMLNHISISRQIKELEKEREAYVYY